MQTGQLESRAVMVKRGRFPGCGGMTTAAGGTQAAVVGVILAMTGDTIGWGAFKHIRSSMAF